MSAHSWTYCARFYLSPCLLAFFCVWFQSKIIFNRIQSGAIATWKNDFFFLLSPRLEIHGIEKTARFSRVAKFEFDLNEKFVESFQPCVHVFG